MVKRFDITQDRKWVNEGGELVYYTDYAALQASHARLLEAARLAKIDIDYVLTAHPEITGLWVRNDAKKELDSAIAAAQPFTET